jgi:hypothetical protein
VLETVTIYPVWVGYDIVFAAVDLAAAGMMDFFSEILIQIRDFFISHGFVG